MYLLFYIISHLYINSIYTAKFEYNNICSYDPTPYYVFSSGTLESEILIIEYDVSIPVPDNLENKRIKNKSGYPLVNQKTLGEHYMLKNLGLKQKIEAIYFKYTKQIHPILELNCILIFAFLPEIVDNFSFDKPMNVFVTKRKISNSSFSSLINLYNSDPSFYCSFNSRLKQGMFDNKYLLDLIKRKYPNVLDIKVYNKDERMQIYNTVEKLSYILNIWIKDITKNLKIVVCKNGCIDRFEHNINIIVSYLFIVFILVFLIFIITIYIKNKKINFVFIYYVNMFLTPTCILGIHLIHFSYRRTFSIWENILCNFIGLLHLYHMMSLLLIHSIMDHQKSIRRIDYFIYGLVSLLAIVYVQSSFKSSDILVTQTNSITLFVSLWENRLVILFASFTVIISIVKKIFIVRHNNRPMGISLNRLLAVLQLYFAQGVCAILICVFFVDYNVKRNMSELYLELAVILMMSMITNIYLLFEVDNLKKNL